MLIEASIFHSNIVVDRICEFPEAEQKSSSVENVCKAAKHLGGETSSMVRRSSHSRLIHVHNKEIPTKELQRGKGIARREKEKVRKRNTVGNTPPDSASEESLSLAPSSPEPSGSRRS
ncbi:hypothetical protein OIU76_013499 [Salix suchowensis]|nr:hypothetical protein OIU76_013499 [Salix suchowensis]